LLAYGCGQQQNQWQQKFMSNAGDFDGHVDTAVQFGAHHLMECICGFMQSG
jgi:hypothetical protein